MMDGLDIRESSARIRRIVISLFVGVAVSVLVWTIGNALVPPDPHPAAVVSTRQMSGGTFVLWLTLLSGTVALTAALGIQNAIARKRWREQHEIAKARVV